MRDKTGQKRASDVFRRTCTRDYGPRQLCRIPRGPTQGQHTLGCWENKDSSAASRNWEESICHLNPEPERCIQAAPNKKSVRIAQTTAIAAERRPRSNPEWPLLSHAKNAAP